MNNNWIEEFDKLKITGIGEWYKSADYWTITGFISNLLTKKDQEHKAELEMIKEEIEKYKRIEMAWVQIEGTKKLEKNIDKDPYNEGLQDALLIIDRHINSLTTE